MSVDQSTTLAHLRRRIHGSFDIDEWGLDPELVATTDPLVSLRWDTEVDVAGHVPTAGGAVLVFNRRLGISEPWVLARGIRRATGRFVRTVGVPDHAPVGPFLRRFGAVMDRPDEIEGLLRASQLVGLPLSRRLTNEEQAGHLELDRVEAVLAAGVPVIPVALVGREIGRRWRIVVGPPVPTATRQGPLSSADLADAASAAVQDLLNDAVPAGWLW
ncbi:MAG: hypothetical protein ABI239_04225 [Aquihabitans sp.]